jgi:Repeat of unknown function (DUF5648)
MNPIRLLRTLACLALVLVVPSFAPAFWIGPPPVRYVSVKEYVNDFTHHYVLLSDPREIGDVEAGAAGPGWRFTGYTFSAFDLEESSAVAQDAVPVCRFYAPPPTNSHFFTANADECDFLRTHDTGWQFEKIEYKIDVPHDGACPAGLAPIYRQYNNRAAFLDSNHRFSTDDRVRAKMASQGWIDEGIAFCSNGGRAIRTSRFIAATGEFPSAGCTTRAGEAPCISLAGLADMTQSISKFLPPTFSQPNPAYSPEFAEITGWLPVLDTVYSASPFASDAARHSFVEWVGMPVGVHVNGGERQQGDYASASPTYRFNPALAAADPRIFPWGDGHEHDVFVDFQLAIKTVRRADASSHAYGGPVLDFLDSTSGRHLLVTVLAYGTQPPGDFVGRDASNGAPIVSTSFRGDPLFGKALEGRFIPCTADAASGSCSAAGIDFRFRIDQDDFAKVVALARSLDPALSPNIADYCIAYFQVRNETFRDAELGLEEHAVSLQLTY